MTGATIRAIRHTRGLRLSDVAGPGLSKGHLSHIESGRYAPSDATLRTLATRLDVAPDVLAGRVPPIATLRDLRGITPADLAAAAGITTTHLDHIEHGSETPRPEHLDRIAVRLGVDPLALGAQPEEIPA